MEPEQARSWMGLSALAGAAVTGLYTVYMAMAARAPATAADWWRLGIDVVGGAVVGGLVAYFLGPTVAAQLPAQIGGDPRAVGFGIGFAAWGAIPFVQRLLRAWGERWKEKV